MRFLIATWLLIANPEFPELDEAYVEDVELDEAAGPVWGPDDTSEVENWENVDPASAVVEEATVAPVAAPAPAPRVITAVTVRSTPATSAPRPTASVPAPTAPRFSLDGYLGVKWGAPRELVETVVSPSRPLLSQGAGKWLATQPCENRPATIVFRFDAANRLDQVVCVIKNNGDGARADEALYREISAELDSRWGRAHVLNEPSAEGDTYAAAWMSDGVQAVISFFPRSASLQISVERKNH